MQKLHLLSKQLEGAEYREFWSILDGDDLYADLVADCSGFEELMRLRIAMAVAQAFREIKREILEGYLNMQGEAFEGFIKNVCVWTLEGDRVKIPLNKENEAITTVTREVVKIDRTLPLLLFLLFLLLRSGLWQSVLTVFIWGLQSLAESSDAHTSSRVEKTVLSYQKSFISRFSPFPARISASWSHLGRGKQFLI